MEFDYEETDVQLNPGEIVSIDSGHPGVCQSIRVTLKQQDINLSIISALHRDSDLFTISKLLSKLYRQTCKSN